MTGRRILGAVGAGLTVVALIAILAPGVVTGLPVLGPGLETLAGLGTTALWLAGGLAALALVALARGGSDPESVDPADEQFAAVLETPPEVVATDRGPPAGADLDARIERAVEAGGPPLWEVQGRLRETATTVYAEREGVDEEKARAAVDAGTWTEERTAAALLSGDAGPEPPVRARLALWLAPGRERRRRVERTVAAIERLGEPP